MRRSRSRVLPDNVRRAVLRQHPDAFNVPASKPFEKPEPVQLVGNGAPRSAPLRVGRDGSLRPGQTLRYGNKRVIDEDTGEKFDSKLEHRVWKALVAKYGERNVMKQVAIPFRSGVKFKPDFIVLSPIREGEARYIIGVFDAKGPKPSEAWRNKAKTLKAEYGLTVQIIRKPSEV